MKNKTKLNLSLSQSVILLLILAASININNLYFYFIFIAFFASLLFTLKKMRMNWSFVILCVLSFSYLIFFPKARTDYLTMIKQFVFPISYLIGLNFNKADNDCEENNHCNENNIILGFAVFSLGAFVHYMLNMIINFNSLSRNTIDIWTGDVITATGQACLAAMATGFFASLIFAETKSHVKFISFIGIVMIFAYNLVLAGRTLLLLMAIVFIVAFFYSVKSSSYNSRVKLSVFVALGIVVILIIYVQNIFGVRDLILGSNLSARFDETNIIDDARWGYKLEYLKHLFDYPFGGGALHRMIGAYAHGLYFDVYSDVGVFGYAAVVVFVLTSVKKAWTIVRSDGLNKDFKLVIICLYIAVLLEFFLEPIIQGMPWLFCAFCFFSGMLSNVNISVKNELAEKQLVEE